MINNMVMVFSYGKIKNVIKDIGKTENMMDKVFFTILKEISKKKECIKMEI